MAVKIYRGINSDGEIIHISEAQSDSSEYTCTKCEKTLIPIKGRIYAHHFRHKVETGCSGGPETDLHKSAKRIIRTAITMLLPRNEELKYEFVAEEELREDVKPDVIVRNLNSGEEWYIEIGVRNLKKDVDRERYKKIGKFALEIDISKSPYSISDKDLKDIVLTKFHNKTYLCYPKPEVKTEKLDLTIPAFIAAALLFRKPIIKSVKWFFGIKKKKRKKRSLKRFLINKYRY